MLKGFLNLHFLIVAILLSGCGSLAPFNLRQALNLSSFPINIIIDQTQGIRSDVVCTKMEFGVFKKATETDFDQAITLPDTGYFEFSSNQGGRFFSDESCTTESNKAEIANGESKGTHYFNSFSYEDETISVTTKDQQYGGPTGSAETLADFSLEGTWVSNCMASDSEYTKSIYIFDEDRNAEVFTGSYQSDADCAEGSKAYHLRFDGQLTMSGRQDDINNSAKVDFLTSGIFITPFSASMVTTLQSSCPGQSFTLNEETELIDTCLIDFVSGSTIYQLMQLDGERLKIATGDVDEESDRPTNLNEGFDTTRQEE